MEPDDTYSWDGSLIGGNVSNYTDDDSLSYNADTNSVSSVPVASSGSSSFSSTINSSAPALNTISNSIASIFKNITGSSGNVVYAPNGQAVALPGSLQSTASNVASNLTAAVIPFLPLIGIALVVWFLFGVFSKHGRR